MRRLNLPGVLRDALGHIAFYRWKYRYFKYPVDLMIIQYIDDVFYLW